MFWPTSFASRGKFEKKMRDIMETMRTLCPYPLGLPESDVPEDLFNFFFLCVIEMP